MDLHIRCTKCGKRLAVDEKSVGMIINCPDCPTALRVPLIHEKQICPHCRGETLVANNMNGQSIECSSCHKTFPVKSLNDPKHHACPFCYTAILVPDDFKGQFINCPTCNQRYMIHRPNLDFQHRQQPSAGPVDGWPIEATPQEHAARKYKRIKLISLLLAWILPVLAVWITDAYAASQTKQIVQIALGCIWLIAMSFLGRLVRLALPLAGVIWGSSLVSDNPFTGTAVIIISTIIGIIFYRLPVLGREGQLVSLRQEWAERAEEKRQRQIEHERRSLESSGHPLLLISVIIIIALMFIPGFRHWFISAFKFDSPQTAETTASSGRTDEWVSGVPKASQARQQAMHASRKTGKKFTGMDSQESLSNVEINNGMVAYSKPITENEASALARFLVPVIFDGTKTGIVLSYSDGYYILGKSASAQETNIDGFHKAYAMYAREISNQVFGGKPVKFCFFDKEMNILAEISDSEGKKEFKEYQESLAYQRGFEHGQRMGKQDREMASYNHLWPDSPENTIFDQVAHLAGCDPGTPEYADFAEGYDMGYRAAR